MKCTLYIIMYTHIIVIRTLSQGFYLDIIILKIVLFEDFVKFFIYNNKKLYLQVYKLNDYSHIKM